MPMRFRDIKITSLRTIFSIDLRSLALFRVSLGVMLLVNLYLRVNEVGDFYSEDGVHNRSQSVSHADVARFSLYWIHASDWSATGLMVLSAVAALLLIVGYKSRLMAFVSWVLLVSLVNRNQFVLQAGDQLLVMLVFWSLFLPIGARASVDNALDRRYRDDADAPVVGSNDETASERFISVATVGLILQVVFIYLFTAILKTGAPWRETMDAAYYAVQLDHIATPIGHFMRDFPGLLTLGTWFVLCLEFVVVFLVLSPIFHTQLRLLAVVLLVFLHGVFLLSLHIGLFPFFDFVSLTILVPSAVWTWLESRKAAAPGASIRLLYDGECGFCRKTCLVLREFFLPRESRIQAADTDAEAKRLMQEHNSWVVMDQASKPLLGWQALSYVIRQRRLFWPLGALMGARIFRPIGDGVYRFVASRRYAFSRFTERLLPYTNIMRRPSVLNQCLAAAAVYLLVYGNLNSVGVDYNYAFAEYDAPKLVSKLDDVHSAIIKGVRIEQNWNMFAPKPPVGSFFPVVPGTLVDGTKVDVYNERMTEPDWQSPDPMFAAYKSYRWRKYFENVNRHTSNIPRHGYGAFLCRRWNTDDRPPEKRLGILEVWLVNHMTRPNNLPKPEKRTKKWVHWCLPEFAPDKTDKNSRKSSSVRTDFRYLLARFSNR